jgi:hypothetical protein
LYIGEVVSRRSREPFLLGGGLLKCECGASMRARTETPSARPGERWRTFYECTTVGRAIRTVFDHFVLRSGPGGLFLEPVPREDAEVYEFRDAPNDDPEALVIEEVRVARDRNGPRLTKAGERSVTVHPQLRRVAISTERKGATQPQESRRSTSELFGVIRPTPR